MNTSGLPPVPTSAAPDLKAYLRSVKETVAQLTCELNKLRKEVNEIRTSQGA